MARVLINKSLCHTISSSSKQQRALPSSRCIAILSPNPSFLPGSRGVTGNQLSSELPAFGLSRLPSPALLPVFQKDTLHGILASSPHSPRTCGSKCLFGKQICQPRWAVRKEG